MSLPAQIQLANTFGNWVDATNAIIVTAGNSSHYILVSQNSTPTVSTGNISVNGVMTLITLKANGGIGTTGQFLTSNGTGIHWSTLSVVDANSTTSGLVNTAAQSLEGSKTFLSTVTVTGAATLSNTLAVTGTVTGGTYNGQTINATASLTGTLAVTGAATLSNTLAVTGTVTGGTYNGQTINATASLTGTLAVTGAATLSNTLAVTGAATLSNTLAVTGTVTGGTYNGQTINATASLTGTLGVTGAATLSNTLAVTGATTLSNTLAVTGTVTGGTYNGQTINATASLTGTLGVTGAATLSNTLAVTGAATLSNTLAVTGDLTLSKGISANGGFGTAGQFLTTNSTYAYWSTLSVVDANSSASGLVNTSTQTFTGNKTFGNDVGISGNLTVSGTTTYINTTNLQIGDNIVTLNADLLANVAPTESAGIEINRGTLANTIFRWNETDDVWQATTDGTNYGTLIDTLSTTGINASALSTGTVPLARLASANTTANGVVDTTTQSFAGGKTFTGATTLSSTLAVTGATTLSSTLGVTGAITAAQAGNIIPFYFANQAAFPSASTYHGAIAHSHSDGKVYFAHGGSWIEIIDVSSTQTMTNKTMSGVLNGTVGATTANTGAFTTLGATGAATLSSTLGVTGAATLSSTLGVTGAATLSNTLAVTGATTLSSTAGITGAATLSNTLAVTGATTLSSTLGVTGATTMTTSIFNANTSTGMSANGKLTLNTTNGRFVLPVGADLWAL